VVVKNIGFSIWASTRSWPLCTYIMKIAWNHWMKLHYAFGSWTLQSKLKTTCAHNGIEGKKNESQLMGNCSSWTLYANVPEWMNNPGKDWPSLRSCIAYVWKDGSRSTPGSITNSNSGHYV
jgi:hypothetical protein